VQEREFEAFVRCWNEGRFFEAHEALESLWMRTRDRGQQGLIQLAVALHHVRRGNPRGARTMIGRALPRLLDPSAARSPVDLAAAAEYATRLGDAIDAGDADKAADARPRW
jgi:predicted metal-dependent hydrolase